LDRERGAAVNLPLAVAFEVDNNMLMGGIVVALLTSVGGIIGSLAVVKGWIREVAGVKEVTTTEISGQPLRFEMQKEPLTVEGHNAICGPLHRRVSVLESDVRAIRLKMDADKHELLAAGEERAHAIHERINVLISSVGELKGVVSEVAKRVK
jgi:hypothetical protein